MATKKKSFSRFLNLPQALGSRGLGRSQDRLRVTSAFYPSMCSGEQGDALWNNRAHVRR